MRSRRKFAMIAAFVVSVAVVCFVVEQRKRPAISVTQISYRKLLGGRLLVDFEVANSGKTPIEFHRWQNLMLRTENGEGWRDALVFSPRDVEKPMIAPPSAGLMFTRTRSTDLPIILLPGTRTTARIELPAHIRRWQIGYSVTSPAKQQQVGTTIIDNVRNRIGRYFPQFFVESAPTAKEVWAQPFDSEAWLIANADAPVYMDIPFGAMFRDPTKR